MREPFILPIEQRILARHVPAEAFARPIHHSVEPVCPACRAAGGRVPAHAAVEHDGVRVGLPCRDMVAFRRWLGERATEIAGTLSPIPNPTIADLVDRARICEGAAFLEFACEVAADQRRANESFWRWRVIEYLRWRRSGRNVGNRDELLEIGARNGWTHKGFNDERRSE